MRNQLQSFRVVLQFCMGPGCRLQKIVPHLQATADSVPVCGKCDACLNPSSAFSHKATLKATKDLLGNHTALAQTSHVELPPVQTRVYTAEQREAYKDLVALRDDLCGRHQLLPEHVACDSVLRNMVLEGATTKSKLKKIHGFSSIQVRLFAPCLALKRFHENSLVFISLQKHTLLPLQMSEFGDAFLKMVQRHLLPRAGQKRRSEV